TCETCHLARWLGSGSRDRTLVRDPRIRSAPSRRSPWLSGNSWTDVMSACTRSDTCRLPAWTRFLLLLCHWGIRFSCYGSLLYRRVCWRAANAEALRTILDPPWQAGPVHAWGLRLLCSWGCWSP